MKKILLFCSVIMIASIASWAQDVDLEDGLVFYLTCDNGKTTDEINEAEGEVFSTLSNDVGIKGEENGSLFFNGVDAMINFVDSDIDGLPEGGDERSICLWLKTTDTNGSQEIISWGTTDNGQHTHLSYRNGNTIRNGYWFADYDAPAELSDGLWHHVVATLGDMSVIYIDGEVAAEAELVADTELNTVLNGSFRVGSRNNHVGEDDPVPGWSEGYEGSLDEVRIYDRPLTQEEVTALFNFDPTTVGVRSIQSENFKVYPSKVGTTLNLSTNLDITSIEIYNMAGMVVKTAGSVSRVSVAELKQGLYIVKGYSSNGSYSARFIKE